MVLKINFERRINALFLFFVFILFHVRHHKTRRFRKRNWVALVMISIFGELDNLDKEVYYSFPMFMTFCKSLEETMVFRWLYIRAVRDIATHWDPAFNPNKVTLS